MNEVKYYELTIDKIRSGDIVARDKFLVYIWHKVKRYLRNVPVKAEYIEDIAMDIMIRVIKLIDNNQFDSLTSYVQIHMTITRGLYNYLLKSLMIEYNGKFITWQDYPKKNWTALRQNIDIMLENGIEDITFSNLPKESLRENELLRKYECILGKKLTLDEDYFTYLITLKDLISELNDKDRYIICSYLGLFDYEQKGIRTIAREFNCSTVNISDIYHRILKNLRKDLELNGKSR